MAAITSDAREGLAQLVGVHGGEGTLRCKRLGTGNMMDSDVDAFAVAEMPPGSRAGRHVHSRTSEAMVYVLSGDGRAHLAATAQSLREGIALTIFRGELLHLTAGPEAPLDIFLAEMNTHRSEDPEGPTP